MRRLSIPALLAALCLLLAASCIKLDFFLFDSDSLALDDYDFTSADLDGIDPSRITSELIPVGDSGEGMHIIFIERDPAELDPQIDLAERVTVLYSHGNRGNLALYFHRASHYEDMGFNVLLYDYRGYGASDGETTEEGIYEDVAAAHDYLEGRDDVGQILSVGYSMGGAPAIWLCSPESEREVFACFTESTMASSQMLIDASADYDFPVSWYLETGFESAERIETVTVPLLLMHGVLDQRVAVDNGDILWERARGVHELSRYFRIDEAGHRNVPVPAYAGADLPVEYSHPDELPPELRPGYEQYKERIVRFVAEALAGGQE